MKIQWRIFLFLAQYAPQQQQPPPDVVIPMPGPSNADNTTEEFCVSIPEDEHGQIAIHNISKNQDDHTL